MPAYARNPRESGNFVHARIDMITRGFALRPVDDTPLVSEICNPAYADFIDHQPEHVRDVIPGEFSNTNYAVVDADPISTLCGILYQQQVAGSERLAIISMREVVDVGCMLASIVLNVRVISAERPATRFVTPSCSRRAMSATMAGGCWRG